MAKAPAGRLARIRIKRMTNPVAWTYQVGHYTGRLKKYIVDYYEMKAALPNVPARHEEITNARRYRVFNLLGVCLILIWK